jgi:hypothetical protein
MLGFAPVSESESKTETSDPVPIEVDVYFRNEGLEKVFRVAPGVFLSEEHTVCIAGKPSDPDDAAMTNWHVMGGNLVVSRLRLWIVTGPAPPKMHARCPL